MSGIVTAEYLDEEVSPRGPVFPGAKRPYEFARQGTLDAGYDLAAAFQDYQIPPRGNIKIRCGVKLEIPSGLYAKVVMRSGHGFGSDLSCHIGTVDEPFRGELKVKVRNHSDQPVTIHRGERFAQAIFMRYETPHVREGKVSEDTERGAAGFGSTGLY